MKTVKINVKGRVQGVFYRVFTQRKAEELGLVGYVKNLPDQSVEIVAYGLSEKLKDLTDWSEVGSPFANVDSIDVKLVPNQRFTMFAIR